MSIFWTITILLATFTAFWYVLKLIAWLIDRKQSKDFPSDF